MATIRPSIAVKMIATDFLWPHYRVSVALRQMNRCGHFTDAKPARYWFTLMRKLWRDVLRKVDNAEKLQENIPTSVQPKQRVLVAVSESTRPKKSIIVFLLVTLCLTNSQEIGPGDWNLAV